MIDIVAELNNILDNALRLSSSDVHIEPKFEGISIKCRIHGHLVEQRVLATDYAPQLFSRLKVMIKGDMTKKNIAQEGRLTYESDICPPVDIRVIISPTVLGEKATLRILQRNDLLKSLPELGMLPEVAQRFSQCLRSRHGLLLISGPTGSGKTTTMYASLLEIKNARINLVTIEDPVEYIVNDINQIQLSPENELTFASVLRYVVRMDPDVIFVGEIRDRETASLACSAALTGHMVVATIHANDSISAVTRLYNMGVEPFLIAHALAASLAQILVPASCELCSGAGCDICAGSGISGRVGLFELLTFNNKLRELIIQPPYTMAELAEAAAGSFYRTLAEDGAEKVKTGALSRKDLQLAGISVAD